MTLRRRPVRGDPGCMHRSAYLAAVVFANGKRHVCDYCPDCQRQSEYYGKSELIAAGVEIDGLEVVQDNRCGEKCAVCGSPDGVELHHFAPQALVGWFRNPEAWPTALLCCACHAEWHRAVTPDLVAHGVTMHELAATRRMGLRELTERARAWINGMDRDAT